MNIHNFSYMNTDMFDGLSLYCSLLAIIVASNFVIESENLSRIQELGIRMKNQLQNASDTAVILSRD